MEQIEQTQPTPTMKKIKSIGVNTDIHHRFKMRVQTTGSKNASVLLKELLDKP